MKVLVSTDNAALEKFLSTVKERSVFHSQLWKKFTETIPGIIGSEFWEVRDTNDVICASMLVFFHSLPGGKQWWYAPLSPLFGEQCDVREAVQAIKSFAKRKARAQKNVVYLRMEPGYENDTLETWLKGAFQKSLVSYQPEASLKLALDISEEEILVQMKPKGRYNIRLSEKKGVEVYAYWKNQGRWEKEDGAPVLVNPAENFYTVFSETTARDGFAGRDQGYYEELCEALGENGQLLLAFHEGETISGGIFSYMYHQGIYHFGASSNHKRNLMAPYGVQWKAIREARNRGCRVYDFLGIAPPNIPNHPWNHVTVFKKKFGGFEEVYPGSWQIVFRPWTYKAIQCVKKVKKLLG